MVSITRYLKPYKKLWLHCLYLHGPMVPWRGWRGGQCWLPWSGSGLLHNWWWTPRTLDTAEAAATSLLCPSSTFPGFHFKYRLCGPRLRVWLLPAVPLLLTIAWRGRVIDFYHPSHSTPHTNEMLPPTGTSGEIISHTIYKTTFIFIIIYIIYCTKIITFIEEDWPSLHVVSWKPPLRFQSSELNKLQWRFMVFWTMPNDLKVKWKGNIEFWLGWELHNLGYYT